MNRQPTTPDAALDTALRAFYQAEVPSSFQEKWQSAVLQEEAIQMDRPVKNRKLFTHVILPTAAAVVFVLGSLWVGAQESVSPLSPSPSLTRSGQSDLTYYSVADMGAGSTSASNAASFSSGANSDAFLETAEADPAASAAMEGQKLVRTASLTLRTATYDSDWQAIQTLLSNLEGYVENSYESGDAQNGAARSMDVSLRVPSQHLDVFLSGLNSIGRVVNRSQSVTDRTIQYNDNQARLQTLRDKHSRLTQLLQSAENVSDLVEIESALADTQYQIDSYETAQRSIDRQVEMSQVSVTLLEDSPVAVTSEMSMGDRLSQAFQASVRGLGRFLRNLLVFTVMALPVLLPLSLALLFFLLCRKHKLKKNSSLQKTEEIE